MSRCSSPRLDTPAIERRLRDLWKEAAGSGKAEETQAVMRAGMLNLVVFAPGEGAEQSVMHTISAITRDHPGRVVLLIPVECGTPGDGAIETQVTMLCNSLCCGRQVCGEQIVVRCGIEQLSYLPSLVRPLLEADLPRVLWWRSSPAFGSPLFDQLAGTTGRVILDSALAPAGCSGMINLGRHIRGTPGTVFADLAWSRLEPWRTALAGIFDVEAHMEQIGRIERIEIAFDRGHPSVDVSGPALLTAGWLATRLGLEIDKPLHLTGDEEAGLRLAGGDHPLAVLFHASDEGESIAGLTSVRLATPDSAFRVECIDAGHLAGFAGDQWGPRVFPVRGPDETKLISDELDIPGRDRAFEDVMRFTAEMEQL